MATREKVQSKTSPASPKSNMVPHKIKSAGYYVVSLHSSMMRYMRGGVPFQSSRVVNVWYHDIVLLYGSTILRQKGHENGGQENAVRDDEVHRRSPRLGVS